MNYIGTQTKAFRCIMLEVRQVNQIHIHTPNHLHTNL